MHGERKNVYYLEKLAYLNGAPPVFILYENRKAAYIEHRYERKCIG